MTTPRTLARHVGYKDGAILTPSDTDDTELAHVHQEELADEIVQRYNAPLIVLGRVKEQYIDRDTDNGIPVYYTQYRVIHNGERKLMIEAEIEELTIAMPLVE